MSFNTVYYLFSIEYIATIDLPQLYNQNPNLVGNTAPIQIKICAEYQVRYVV